VNQFALLTIGLVLGILASTLVTATAVIAWAAWKLRRDSVLLATTSLAAIRRNTQATLAMKSEVTLALAAMDATRLHDASQQIQRAVKQLIPAVTLLSRIVLAEGGQDQTRVAAAISDTPSMPPEALESFVDAGLGSLNEMDDNFVGPVQQPGVAQWEQPAPTIQQAVTQFHGEQSAESNGKVKLDPLFEWSLKRQSEQQERARMQDEEAADTLADSPQLASLELMAEAERVLGPAEPVAGREPLGDIADDPLE
jgi:hypothetical protein